MSEKYKFYDPKGAYFVTLTVVYWIDLFTRKEVRHIVLDSLRFNQQEKGMLLHAWVMMPSHLHLIFSSVKEKPEAIIRDFKKHTSKEIVRQLPQMQESRRAWLLKAFQKAGQNLKRIQQYKVWQDGNHPILLSGNEWLQQKLHYIHHNPVEAELVDEPEYYWYSSARDYAGQKGWLDLSLL
jgi:putative transposase